MQNFVLFITLVLAAVIPSLQQGTGFRSFPSLRTSSLINRDLFAKPVFPSFPSIDIPKNCSDAKQSCAKKCGSVDQMNFQCTDTVGVSSSCSCALTPGSSSGSSTTPRCLAAKAACAARCSGKDSFRCSDSGNSFSQSCSCVSETGEEEEVVIDQPVTIDTATDKFSQDSHIDALTMNYKQFDTQQDEDAVVVVEPVVQLFEDEEEEEEVEEKLQNPFFFNFPSIKMDPFSNRNGLFSSSFASNDPFNSNNFVGTSFASSSGSFGLGNTAGLEVGTDVCENAKKQCQLQCEGLKMDFDCKNEGGSYAKSCSCAGSSGDSAAFSSSTTLPNAAFENIM